MHFHRVYDFPVNRDALLGLALDFRGSLLAEFYFSCLGKSLQNEVDSDTLEDMHKITAASEMPEVEDHVPEVIHRNDQGDPRKS